MMPHLNWNEHCKVIKTRANKRILHLWRIGNLNIEQESWKVYYCRGPGSGLFSICKRLLAQTIANGHL